jgi:DNA gyrase subunit A
MAPKTSRTTIGVGVMNLKPRFKVERAVILEESGIANAARYRARSIPVAGSLIKDEDRTEKQMSLL